ncbi:MAG TPA: ABC transporter substrate-binding protein [Acidimicrobiales bacterium]|jgi:sn-glycerol 3-phosphate transport system substrate-binding protein|nr:ABC transporter substrate-binding protein [Acidimicrobiales bacterium]HRA33382.1 ABC transporter substrate-binding protein [Acidimicrobiales bacterium]
MPDRPDDLAPDRTVRTARSAHPARFGRPPRARRVALSVAAVGGLLLAACGGPPTSGDQEAGGRTTVVEGEGGGGLPECPLEALEEATAPVKLDLWYGGLGGSTQQTMEAMATKFNASQDKVVVTANNQGNAYEEVLRKYQAASSKPNQLPQVIYLEDTALGEMVDKGQVLPAEACMEADGYDTSQLLPAARAEFSVDGVLWPGYMNVSTPMLYFNKVHFQKAGLDPNDPPETMAEVREVAQKLKDAGVSEKPLSFKVNRWFFETWLAGINQDIVNNGNGREAPATEASFNTPEAVDLLEFLNTMNTDGLLNPFAATEGSIDHYLALVSEQSSMLIETSTASTTIRDALGGEITAAEAGIDFDISAIDNAALVPGGAPFPGIESPGKVFASGGAFYILNTGTPAQQAASWKFLQFMLQPENAMEWHTSGGYLPVVKSVLEEDSVTTFWETDVAGVLLLNAVDQLRAADPDQSGPLIGPFPTYTEAIQGALEGVLFSGTDAAAALDTAEAAVNETLTDYNGG